MTNQNPHCEKQWPHTENGHVLASLREALTGAAALARLLVADNNIRDNRDDSDTPDEEDQPFGANIRGGLHAALLICVNEADGCADKLSKLGVRS